MSQQKSVSQIALLKEFFEANPNREIPHPEVVDWVVATYKTRTGEVFRDPDRGIRKLAQDGFLIKIRKGVYKYDPDYIENRELEDFTPAQKKVILARDEYRCVICGKGEREGVELHVDHIKPKEYGGEATIENGQTLCEKHNYIKKTYKQTETGKKMFIRLYELAQKSQDYELVKFCTEILEVFERNNINGHIKWKK